MLMALLLCVFFMDLRTNSLSWLFAYTSLRDWFCVTELESVYCAVRTKSYKSRYFLVLKALKNSPRHMNVTNSRPCPVTPACSSGVLRPIRGFSVRHLQVCTPHHHYEINISTISDPLQMDCSNKSDEGGHQQKVAFQVILYSKLSQKCSSVFRHGMPRVLWGTVEY